MKTSSFVCGSVIAECGPSIMFSGPGSMASLPSAAFGSIYQKLWVGLAAMEQDPHPAASQMAKQVMEYIREQVYKIMITIINYSC